MTQTTVKPSFGSRAPKVGVGVVVVVTVHVLYTYITLVK
jgi:hypothetical protein